MSFGGGVAVSATSHTTSGRRRQRPVSIKQAWRESSVGPEASRVSPLSTVSARTSSERPVGRRSRDQVGFGGVAGTHATSRSQPQPDSTVFKPLTSRDSYYRTGGVLGGATFHTITPGLLKTTTRADDSNRGARVHVYQPGVGSSDQSDMTGTRSLALRNLSTGNGSDRSSRKRTRPACSSIPSATAHEILTPGVVRDDIKKRQREHWNREVGATHYDPGIGPWASKRYHHQQRHYQHRERLHHPQRRDHHHQQPGTVQHGVDNNSMFIDEKQGSHVYDHDHRSEKAKANEAYNHHGQRSPRCPSDYDRKDAIPIGLPSPSTASSISGVGRGLPGSPFHPSVRGSRKCRSSTKHDGHDSPKSCTPPIIKGVGMGSDIHGNYLLDSGVPSWADVDMEGRGRLRGYCVHEGRDVSNGLPAHGYSSTSDAIRFGSREVGGYSDVGFQTGEAESNLCGSKDLHGADEYNTAVASVTLHNSRGEEELRGTKAALSRAEAHARQEVEAARAGVEVERLARVAAEASLSNAHRTLEETRGMLQESIANGSVVALSALLEENVEAEAKAQVVMEPAEAAVESARQGACRRSEVSPRREVAAQCVQEEFEKAKMKREEAQIMIFDDQRAARERKREFRVALHTARTEASAGRGRGAAFQARLEQTEVAGLKAKLASLTSDKSAGQARAAALEAKLTRATEERRTRAKESREANESAAGRLSAAESRASEAEAMVQAVSRRLRASEGRLRAAETMATATIASATGTEEETGPAGEALSPVDANAMVKRETARGLVDTENAHFSLSSGVGGVRSQDDRVLAAHGALGRAAAAAQKLLRRKKAAEQRSDELDRALVDARRNHKHSSDKFLSPIARGSSFAQVAGMPAARKTVVRCATDEVGCNEIEILVRERNAADTRVVELENVLAEAHSRIRLLQHIQINTCNSDADRKEPQNREAHQANVCDVLHLTEAQHRFRKAEKEATESRTELDWAKAHALTTAAEVARGRAQAVRNAEELGRELRSAEEEVFRLHAALDAAHATNDLVKKRAESRLEAMVLSVKEEMDGGSKVALAALVEERTDAELRAADFARAANGTREKLEIQLKEAIQAAGAAEGHPDTVRAEGAAPNAEARRRTSTGSTAPIAAEVGGVGDDEQVTSAEAELHLVQIASEKATADLEILRRNLFEVQRACAKAIEGRQAAESRIVELEFGVLEAEKKRALTSERTESRLEVLRLAFEEEEREGAAQGALAALLEEKTAFEARALQLEQELFQTSEAARAAELKSSPLKADFECRTIAATTEEPDVSRIAEAEAYQVAAAAKHAIAAEEASRAAKEALQSAQAKSDHLTGELESARGAELAEAEGRRVAEARIAEFETAKKAAEAEKERIRERAESRLEALKRAFEQEEQEGAAQDALECLLEDKNGAERRAAELERKLHQAQQLAAAVELRLAEDARYKAAITCLLPAGTASSAANAPQRATTTTTGDSLLAIESTKRTTQSNVTAGAENTQHRTETVKGINPTAAGVLALAHSPQRLPASETAIRDAEQAIVEANQEVESLRYDLKRAQAAEATSAERRRTAEEKVAELEGVVEARERKHNLIRRRADARLDQLRLAFDQEERESGVKAALTELLEEKAAIERQNDLTTQEADDSRAKLERKLQLTADALHASESKVEKLQADIDHANVEIANQVAAAAVGGVSSEQAEATAIERAVVAERLLSDVRAESYRTRMKMESLREELNQARTAEAVTMAKAMDNRNSADEKISKLEKAIEDAERDREAMRVRLESRLEALDTAFEQEQQEDAAQTALAALLEETAGLESRAVEAEQRLVAAGDRVLAAETQVRMLEANIQQINAKAIEVERRMKNDKVEATTAAAAAAEAQLVEATNATREANSALQESKAEAESLQKALERARSAEIDAVTAAAAEKRAAQVKAIQLQSVIAQAEREHASFRVRTASQLESLRSTIETEEHGRALQQAVLAKFLEEKSQAEATVVNLAHTLEETRATLEQKLHAAVEALRAAESRAETLKEDLSRANADAAGRVEGATAKGEAVAAASAAASADASAAAKDEATRAATEIAKEMAPAERIETIAGVVRHAEVPSRMLTKDVEASKGQLKCGRAASTVARGDRDSTGARVSELKAATEVAGGEHQHFQHHAASQLQSLGFVAKNEEHKGGEQAEWECLLEEKITAQSRLAELEKQLAEACEAIRAAEAAAAALKFELDRAGCEAAARATTAAAQFRTNTAEIKSSAAEREAIAEAALYKAETSSRERKEETQLQNAPELVRTIEASAAEEKTEARERIARLERTVHCAEREHALFSNRAESRLEGPRAVIAVKEQEVGAETALAALLDEKTSTEMRSTTSERKLELAGETARTGEARADPLKTDLELARKRADNASTVTMAAPVGANDLLCIAFPRHEAVDGNAGEGSKDPDAVTQQNAAGRVPALEIVTATTAAARAMATEVNLSQALKAVAELKARCALAQARQSQVERESTVRVDKLKRELEEATENGPKAALAALLEEMEAVKEANCKHSTRNVELASSAEDVPDDGASHLSSDGAEYYGELVQLRAERDHLVREAERLGKAGEDAICLQQDETYRRTIGVGRYELTLDIVEEDLEDTRQQLAEAQAALRREEDEHLEVRFRALCERVKRAEADRMRVEEHLAETREQLIYAGQAFEEELCRVTTENKNVHASSTIVLTTPCDGREYPTEGNKDTGAACDACNSEGKEQDDPRSTSTAHPEKDSSCLERFTAFVKVDNSDNSDDQVLLGEHRGHTYDKGEFSKSAGDKGEALPKDKTTGDGVTSVVPLGTDVGDNRASAHDGDGENQSSKDKQLKEDCSTDIPACGGIGGYIDTFIKAAPINDNNFRKPKRETPRVQSFHAAEKSVAALVDTFSNLTGPFVSEALAANRESCEKREDGLFFTNADASRLCHPSAGQPGKKQEQEVAKREMDVTVEGHKMANSRDNELALQDGTQAGGVPDSLADGRSTRKWTRVAGKWEPGRTVAEPLTAEVPRPTNSSPAASDSSPPIISPTVYGKVAGTHGISQVTKVEVGVGLSYQDLDALNKDAKSGNNDELSAVSFSDYDELENGKPKPTDSTHYPSVVFKGSNAGEGNALGIDTPAVECPMASGEKTVTMRKGQRAQAVSDTSEVSPVSCSMLRVASAHLTASLQLSALALEPGASTTIGDSTEAVEDSTAELKDDTNSDEEDGRAKEYTVNEQCCHATPATVVEDGVPASNDVQATGDPAAGTASFDNLRAQSASEKKVSQSERECGDGTPSGGRGQELRRVGGLLEGATRGREEVANSATSSSSQSPASATAGQAWVKGTRRKDTNQKSKLVRPRASMLRSLRVGSKPGEGRTKRGADDRDLPARTANAPTVAATTNNANDTSVRSGIVLEVSAEHAESERAPESKERGNEGTTDNTTPVSEVQKQVAEISVASHKLKPPPEGYRTTGSDEMSGRRPDGGPPLSQKLSTTGRGRPALPSPPAEKERDQETSRNDRSSRRRDRSDSPSARGTTSDSDASYEIRQKSASPRGSALTASSEKYRRGRPREVEALEKERNRGQSTLSSHPLKKAGCCLRSKSPPGKTNASDLLEVQTTSSEAEEEEEASARRSSVRRKGGSRRSESPGARR